VLYRVGGGGGGGVVCDVVRLHDIYVYLCICIYMSVCTRLCLIKGWYPLRWCEHSICIHIYELNHACMSVLGLVGGKGDVRDVGGNTVYIYIYIY